MSQKRSRSPSCKFTLFSVEQLNYRLERTRAQHQNTEEHLVSRQLQAAGFTGPRSPSLQFWNNAVCPACSWWAPPLPAFNSEVILYVQLVPKFMGFFPFLLLMRIIGSASSWTYSIRNFYLDVHLSCPKRKQQVGARWKHIKPGLCEAANLRLCTRRVLLLPRGSANRLSYSGQHASGACSNPLGPDTVVGSHRGVCQVTGRWITDSPPPSSDMWSSKMTSDQHLIWTVEEVWSLLNGHCGMF